MAHNTTYRLTWTPEPEYRAPATCEHMPASRDKFCPECGKSTSPDKELAERVAKYIATNSNMGFVLHKNGSTRESGSWYEPQADMGILSRAVRGVLFTLDCKGEDGEVWRVWALNGQTQEAQAEIVVPPLDRSKWQK